MSVFLRELKKLYDYRDEFRSDWLDREGDQGFSRHMDRVLTSVAEDLVYERNQARYDWRQEVRREVAAAKAAGMTLAEAMAELTIIQLDSALAASMWGSDE